MALSIGDMDSGNSASMQSSSGGPTGGGGGGDIEEYDSRSNESISLLFKSAAAAAGTHNSHPEGVGLFHGQLQPHQQQQPPSYHDHYSHSFDHQQPHNNSFSNTTINYFDSSSLPLQPPQTSSLTTDALHNYRQQSSISNPGLVDLDSVWAKTLRVPDTNLNDSSPGIHDQMSSMMMMLPAAAGSTDRTFIPADQHQLAVSFGGDAATTQAHEEQTRLGVLGGGTSSAHVATYLQNQNNNMNNTTTSSNISQSNSNVGNNNNNNAVARNPKKRSRASRRAPTTVLTTDTTNFRAMVQQFTGIPAPPFTSSSPFSRGRLDLFGSGANNMTSSTASLFLDHPCRQPPLPNYLLKPFPQKVSSPAFLPSSTSNNIIGRSSNISNNITDSGGCASYTTAGSLQQQVPPSHPQADHLRDHDDDDPLGGLMMKQDLQLINQNLSTNQPAASPFLHQRYPLDSNIINNPNSSSNPAAGNSNTTSSNVGRSGGDHTNTTTTTTHQPANWSNYGGQLGLRRFMSNATGQSDTKAPVNGGYMIHTSAVNDHEHGYSNTAGAAVNSDHHHQQEVTDGEFVNLQSQINCSKGMLESWITSSTD